MYTYFSTGHCKIIRVRCGDDQATAVVYCVARLRSRPLQLSTQVLCQSLLFPQDSAESAGHVLLLVFRLHIRHVWMFADELRAIRA